MITYNLAHYNLNDKQFYGPFSKQSVNGKELMKRIDEAVAWDCEILEDYTAFDAIMSLAEGLGVDFRSCEYMWQIVSGIEKALAELEQEEEQ